MKGLVIIYGLYLLLLICLLISRIIGLVSFNLLNGMYLFCGIGVLAFSYFFFACGDNFKMSKHQYLIEHFRLISSILLMIPLLLLFITNYLFF